MSNIRDGYEALLDRTYEQRTSYSDDNLCVFSAGIGRKYNKKLMVIGRATNGWINCIADKKNRNLYDEVLYDLEKSLGHTNLDWVAQHRQIDDPKEYNTKKSPFWRLIHRLSLYFSSSQDWPIDCLLWSNLYKVAPQKGNPSARLINIQFECCADILSREIVNNDPHNIVFLTGLSWAGRFLDFLGVKNVLTSRKQFVEFVGVKDGKAYVVGQHPQGKPEEPHCDEIIKALQTLPVESLISSASL